MPQTLTPHLIIHTLREIANASDKIVKEYETDPNWNLAKQDELIHRNRGLHDAMQLLYINLHRKL